MKIDAEKTLMATAIVGGANAMGMLATPKLFQDIMLPKGAPRSPPFVEHAGIITATEVGLMALSARKGDKDTKKNACKIMAAACFAHSGLAIANGFKRNSETKEGALLVAVPHIVLGALNLAAGFQKDD